MRQPIVKDLSSKAKAKDLTSKAKAIVHIYHTLIDCMLRALEVSWLYVT